MPTAPPPTEKISPLAGRHRTPTMDTRSLSLSLSLSQVLKSQVTRTPHAACDGKPVYKEGGEREDEFFFGGD
jgi:hypothetical protein